MTTQTRKKITVEDRAAIFNLPWKVARDEGLLDKAGLNVAFVPPAPWNDPLGPTVDPNKVNSFGSHITFEERTCDLFNACEWGQIKRSHDSKTGGIIVAKRPAVVAMGIYSHPDSKLLVPQDLRNQEVAVRFHNGSHYATLQMLEGFLHRDEIKLVHLDPSKYDPARGNIRYQALLRGDVPAVAFMEPWNTFAEKNGCNRIIETFYYGADIGSKNIDPDTAEAISLVLGEAVRRINADKRKYLHYLAEEIPQAVGHLNPEDFNLSRIRFVEPGVYSKKEFDSTYEWMASWGLVAPDRPFEALVANRLG
jgi:NitT/TauT family transport system substrate-binding protein